MFHHKHARKLGGNLIASVALASWALLGLFGTAAAVADKPQPPPPPADPAIAFVHTVTAHRNTYYYLAVCNADGTNVTDLTALPDGYQRYISWAPGGHSLAFGSISGGIWRIDVSIVNGVPVGSNLIQLTTGAADWGWGIDWFPLNDDMSVYYDTIVYYRSASDGNGLFTIPAQGGQRQLLYSVSGSDGPAILPRWSPDGSQIAYCHPQGYAGDIMLLNVASGIATSILHRADYHQAQGLDWGNASNLLAFSDRWDSSLNYLNLDTMQLTTVASVRSFTFSFSPDDSKVVYGDIATGHLATYTLANGAVATLPVTGARYPEWRRNP